MNKGYLDEKFWKTFGHISLSEKDFNQFKLQYNKESVKEKLIKRGVETTIQILHEKCLFDTFKRADKVLEDFLFTTRRRSDLSEQVNDDIEWFCSSIQFEKQSNK